MLAWTYPFHDTLHRLDAFILKYVVIDTYYCNILLMVGSIMSELWCFQFQENSISKWLKNNLPACTVEQIKYTVSGTTWFTGSELSWRTYFFSKDFIFFYLYPLPWPTWPKADYSHGPKTASSISLAMWFLVHIHQKKKKWLWPSFPTKSFEIYYTWTCLGYLLNLWTVTVSRWNHLTWKYLNP